MLSPGKWHQYTVGVPSLLPRGGHKTGKEGDAADPPPGSKAWSQRAHEVYLRKLRRRHELDPQGAADYDETWQIDIMETRVWEAKQLEKQGWRCADCEAQIDASTYIQRGRARPGGFEVLDFVCERCTPTPPPSPPGT